MKKYVFAIVIVVAWAMTASAQTHLDSVKRYRTRTAKNMGFVVNPGFIGGDGWYGRNWGHGYGGDGLYNVKALRNNLKGKQGYAPLTTPFDTSYRWHEYPQAGAIGMNAFNGLWMWQDLSDSIYINPLDTIFWSATPDTLVTSPRESTTPYCQFGSEAINNAIANSPYARIECERHIPHSKDSEYLGFLAVPGGLTGSNYKEPTGTYPLYLKGSVRSSDTAYNVVRLHKGAGFDAAGVFDSSFWTPKLFTNDDDLAAWIHGDWNRKLLVRLRVRLDSLSMADTISKEITHIPSYTAFTVRVWQGSVERDSVAFPLTSVTFPHAGQDYDTVSFTFLSDSAASPPPLKFELYWPGMNSLDADYLEVMTAKLEIADTVEAKKNHLSLNPWGSWLWNFLGTGGGKYSGYGGLTANHDSLLKSLVHRTISPFDSVCNYVYAVDEPQPGEYNILKRLLKVIRDSTHMEGVPNMQPDDWFPSFGAYDPRRLMLEGVHRGWLDSSEYADPLFFSIDTYLWDVYTMLPVRTKSSDSTTIGNWLAKYAPLYYDYENRVVRNPYSRSLYRATTEAQLEKYVKYFRWCHNITLETRTPSFHQRYFFIGAGGAPQTIRQDSLADSACYFNIRSITGAEMKSQFHTAVAAGASGVQPFILMNQPSPSDHPDMLGYGIVGANGDTGMYAKIDGLRNAAGGTRSDSLWAGWGERYDTAKSLFPLLTRYGDALLACNWMGDFLSKELHASDSLPFQWNSVQAVDDSMRRDTLSSNPSVNRTHLFISVWQDTTTHDTLLYIVNLRTDDSWDTTGKCQTFDRRYIMMHMKAPHLVTDVADTGHYRTMGKIRTPYVGTAASDSLIVWLLPGDGVLVRLTAPDTDMKQMRIALNYPNTPHSSPQDYLDHGSVQFSEYVVGVNPADNLIPSSRYSFVGIKNSQAPTLHQDSLLFQQFATNRPEMWRHQNWTRGSGLGVGDIAFNFKRSLATDTLRKLQTGLDSIAHPVKITTDIEATGTSYGAIGFYDPFFVDESSLNNYNTSSDTLLKSAPFLPQVPMPGATPGAHPDHYGGVFLQQDPLNKVEIPNYVLKAYQAHKWPYPGRWLDTVPPLFTDYSFLEWHKGDVNYPDAIVRATTFPVVFTQDNEIYTALYKVHNLAYESPYTSDTGYSYNNQRKLLYLGRDASNTAWYRNVFSSLGRIYTARGWHPGASGPLNGWVTWEPEQLVTEWNDSTAAFPAIGMHVDTTYPPPPFPHDTTFSYVYQQRDSAWGTTQIFRTTIVNGHRYAEEVSDPSTEALISESTPVIAAIDVYDSAGMMRGQFDVIAYTDSTDGSSAPPGAIAVRIMSKFDTAATTWISDPMFFGEPTAMNPTIWARDSANSSWFLPDKGHWAFPVYLAWQEYDPDVFHRTVPHVSDIWDIYCKPMTFIYTEGYAHPWLDTSVAIQNVSKSAHFLSFDNKRPCISGIRAGGDTMLVMIAYETNQSDLTWVGTGEGITVAKTHPPASGGWTRTTYFPATWDPFTSHPDELLKPSITVTRYTHTVGGWDKTDYFYSLACESRNSSHGNVWHFALDDTSQRFTYNWFAGLRNPQLSVEPNGRDSNVERMSLAYGTWDSPAASGTSRWLIHQNYALFKAAVDHAMLYDYRSVTQSDTVSQQPITQGIGEIQVDDGLHQKWIDLIDREDTLTIDTAHQSSYFMATENFTMPVSGTLTYTPWITTGNDSAFVQAREKLWFRLGFYDSVGSFITALDSFFVCDTLPQIAPAVRSVILSYSSSAYGHLQLDRLTGALLDTGSVQEIISPKMISAAKQANGNRPLNSSDDGVTVEALENPCHGYCDIGFSIPVQGDVSMTVSDLLGRHIADITAQREFRSGEHTVRWSPEPELPSGIYGITLRYGNTLKTIQISYVR